MLDLKETLDNQLVQSKKKGNAPKTPGRYLVSAMLAGAFVGVAVVLMASTAGPLQEGSFGLSKLVSGAVFPVALILVVFAGADLVTSSMMILTQGALSKTIKWTQWGGSLVLCFVGNLLGSALFAFLVTQSGVLHYNKAAGSFIASMLESKSHETNTELFFRGILCNLLVCLAIWCANRCKTEIGKATVIFWCIFAFISSGYEHVVANMTTFSLGLMGFPEATSWADFARNMFFVGTGNLVGGAVFVGVTYWFLSQPTKAQRNN